MYFSLFIRFPLTCFSPLVRAVLSHLHHPPDDAPLYSFQFYMFFFILVSTKNVCLIYDDQEDEWMDSEAIGYTSIPLLQFV